MGAGYTTTFLIPTYKLLYSPTHTHAHTHIQRFNRFILSVCSTAVLGRMLHSERQIMSYPLCRGQNPRASRAQQCYMLPLSHTHTNISCNKQKKKKKKPAKLPNSKHSSGSTTQYTHKPNTEPTLPPTSVLERTALRHTETPTRLQVQSR